MSSLRINKKYVSYVSYIYGEREKDYLKNIRFTLPKKSKARKRREYVGIIQKSIFF